LIAPLDRRNGWTIAEHADEVTPDGMQRLLRLADWDVDGVRDDLRDMVIENLGSADAVLALDETGFLKKGVKSAGVQRQYTGTAGRKENCQVGVFMTYIAPRGHAFIDRDLYLPQSWTDDRSRCEEAGIPEDVEFDTKPRMAIKMLQRALDAKVPFAWFTADEMYGNAKYLREWLHENGVHHVLAVQSNDMTTTADGRRMRIDALFASLAPQSWRQLSCGDGSHGPRTYDWARVETRPEWSTGRGHWVIARRSLKDPDDIAYYVCYGPSGTTLRTLAWVAGRRWPIEECFQQGKNEAGLDQYQVRTWRGWYAHITLSMAAHALLVLARNAAEKVDPPPAR
jgi:SRSO17 transposase